MNGRLIVLSGTRKGSEFELAGGGVTLGRDQSNTVVFGAADDVVSGSHATIWYVPDRGAYVLRDPGSSNGTFVNNRRVQEQELRHGDVVEFGMGGPTARFDNAAVAVAAPEPAGHTQHVGSAGTVTRLLRDARSSSGGSQTIMMKEFVRLAYAQTGRRARRMSIGVAVLGLGVTGAVWAKSEVDRRAADAELADARSEITDLVGRLQLGDERRAAIQGEMETLRQQNVDLRTSLSQVEAESQEVRRELSQAQARADENRNFVSTITDRYGGSVAYLSFAYGWHSEDGQVVRLAVDEQGRVLYSVTAEGDTLPELTLGGPGPAFGGSDGSSCTGFLIDQEGWITTNHHCAEPWVYDEMYQAYRDLLEPDGYRMAFIGGGPTVYFPDDPQGLASSVEAVSNQADVALLKIAPVPHAAIPLGAPGASPRVGENLVLAGYPTGLTYIIQSRLQGGDREAFLAAAEAGQEVRFLIDRELLYPFVAVGRVSDLAAGEIVHDANTYGGASGSPVVGENGRVVGVHHASNPFDVDPNTGRARRGTDFTVKYAAEVGYVWDILPADVRRRLEAR